MIKSPYRIAIYARYSTDLQNPSSIEDQVALCRQLIADQLHADASKAQVFSDAAISGATMERPGVARLLAAVSAGHIDTVVAEGLDRLSRSLKDISAVHEMLGYHGAMIWTAHEGRITELHIGLKGTMNALMLKDLKARIRRGQAGRVAAGYAPSSVPYGYRVVRGVLDNKGRNVNGVREIDEAEAAVIRRIFEECAAGRTVMQIMDGLNHDNIPARGGGKWLRNALVGGVGSEGILHKEIYTGTLVYNRTRNVRNPITGKKQSVRNPESDWIRQHVPALRIISDDLWRQAQLQLRRHRRPQPKGRKPRILTSHNQHALTGWVRCGQCGELKSIANQGRYLCSGNRYTKTCPNSRGTKEPVLMAAVFEALYRRLKGRPNFRQTFQTAFIRETCRHASLMEREAEVLERIDRLMESVERGVDKENVTRRVKVLQDELRLVRQDMKTEAPVHLPDEAAIRTTLKQAVASVEMARDIPRTRLMFQHLLKEIVLTPIPGQPRGETFEITLREEGWPDFWRMIAGT